MDVDTFFLADGSVMLMDMLYAMILMTTWERNAGHTTYYYIPLCTLYLVHTYYRCVDSSCPRPTLWLASVAIML